MAGTSDHWDSIVENHVKQLGFTFARGFTPDWLAYVLGEGYQVDPQHGAVGSYAAIRVYL